MVKQQLASDEDRGNKVIPICFTLTSAENREVMQMFDQAIIAENSEVIHLAQSTIDVSAISNSVKGMYSLSLPKF